MTERMRWIGAGLAAGLLVLACGEPSPEAQLADAREQLERAQQEVASAEARYEETRRKLEKAQTARDEAYEALQKARAQQAEARAEVGRFATDDAIFRAVQKQLLDDEKLSEVAIPVQVKDGVVVLTGEVPDARLAERAEKIASDVAGVSEVRNRIQVQGGSADSGKDRGGKASRSEGSPESPPAGGGKPQPGQGGAAATPEE